MTTLEQSIKDVTLNNDIRDCLEQTQIHFAATKHPTLTIGAKVKSAETGEYEGVIKAVEVKRTPETGEARCSFTVEYGNARFYCSAHHIVAIEDNDPCIAKTAAAGARFEQSMAAECAQHGCD